MEQHNRFEIFAKNWHTEYGAAGGTIYCREGCAGCCHLAVHATYPEAIAVAKTLSTQQAQSLSDYVKRLTNALPGLVDLKAYLKQHRQALGPCPLLDKRGACSIYPMRPLACRALLSTRPAAWCTVDFSELSHWDKQAYEGGLNRAIVAWPTHYVAATQDFGREMEKDLLELMQEEKGWSLSGNFAVMVWLEKNYQLSHHDIKTAQQVHDILVANKLDNHLLLDLMDSRQMVLSD